jgi:hypothetical protein
MTAKLVTLIVTTMTRGEGIKGDPLRNVIQFYTIDGRLVGEADPFTQPELESCVFDECALFSRSPAARGE